jgi:hypothetical protein
MVSCTSVQWLALSFVSNIYGHDYASGSGMILLLPALQLMIYARFTMVCGLSPGHGCAW